MSQQGEAGIRLRTTYGCCTSRTPGCRRQSLDIPGAQARSLGRRSYSGAETAAAAEAAAIRAEAVEEGALEMAALEAYIQAQRPPAAQAKELTVGDTGV